MKYHLPGFCVGLFVVLCLSIAASPRQNQEIQFAVSEPEIVNASSITWRKHFGYRKEEPNNTYILMTQGGFRAPTSENFETLIKSWMTEHQKALATVVFTIEPMMTAIPDSKMKAVLVTDGEANLNIYLVRMGGCPAGTMLLGAGDKTGLRREEYEVFARKVIEAEDQAKKEKLGIWSDSKPAPKPNNPSEAGGAIACFLSNLFPSA